MKRLLPAPAAGALRSVRRAVAYAVTREEVDRLTGRIDEVWERVGRELADIHTALEHLERTSLRPPWANLIGYPLRRLDGFSASFLNYASGPYGFAAQAGLWLDPPVALAYTEASVAVLAVNRQLVEDAFAYQALAGLAPGATILDVGGSGSVALGLAAMGHQVRVATDRPYGFAHPNLEVVSGGLDAAGPGPYEAVLALGSLEALDAPKAGDLAALLRPGGRLVLSMALGRDAPGSERRVFNRRSLAALLRGLHVESERYLARPDPATWQPAAGPAEGAGLALVVVRPA